VLFSTVLSDYTSNNLEPVGLCNDHITGGKQ